MHRILEGGTTVFNNDQVFVPQLPFAAMQYQPRKEWDPGLDRIAGPPALAAFSAEHQGDIAAIERAAAARNAASKAMGDANIRAAAARRKAQEEANEERIRRWRAAVAAMQRAGQVPQAAATGAVRPAQQAQPALTVARPMVRPTLFGVRGFR